MRRVVTLAIRRSRADPATGVKVRRSAGAQRGRARESQLVLGLDPDPARLWPRRAVAIDSAGAAGRAPEVDARRRARPRGRRALRAGDRRHRGAVRRGQARRSPASSGSARPDGARCAETVTAGAGARPAGDRRRQARRHRRHRDGLRAGIPRRDADPVWPGAGPRRGRDDRQPAARAATRSSRCSTTARAHGARAVRARPHLESRAPPTCRSGALADGDTVSGRLADLVAELGRRGIGARSGIAGRRRGRRRHRARSGSRRCASAMPHAVFLLPGRRRPGRTGRGPRARRLRPGPPAA